MTIHEKLDRLMEFASKAAIARAAGLNPKTFYNAIANRSAFSTQPAASLARVLGVDPGWLVDDAQGWPPVRVETLEPQTTA